MNTNTTNSCEGCDSPLVFDLLKSYDDPNLLVNSTCSIESSFYMSDPNHYAMLEKLNDGAPCKLSRLQIDSNTIASKITLIDFPIGNYILNINGHNAMTAKILTSDNCVNYIFDFESIKSHLLEISIEVYRSVDEPVIDGRQNYLNLGKIDCANIICDLNKLVNTSYQIQIDGYYKENNEWIFGSKCQLVYPNNSYNLIFNHPTDCFDIYMTDIQPNAYGKFIIDGNEYVNFDIKSSALRIKCLNKNSKFNLGAQNQYLSDEINSNTINFSRVDRMTLILVGCKCRNIEQYCYNIYLYPYRTAVYSN
jgi:hypothetical protein